MDEVLERELKWDVAEDFALPSLDDIVAEADVERSTVTLSSAYYDTVDGDLQTHGVLLRRRDGDDDAGSSRCPTPRDASRSAPDGPTHRRRS
jgi:inorganic triphosphatase YgiF